jgi:hypothetical protein
MAVDDDVGPVEVVEELVCPVTIGVVVLLTPPVPVAVVDDDVSLVTVCSVTAPVEIDWAVDAGVVVLLTLLVPVMAVDDDVGPVEVVEELVCPVTIGVVVLLTLPVPVAVVDDDVSLITVC